MGGGKLLPSHSLENVYPKDEVGIHWQRAEFVHLLSPFWLLVFKEVHKNSTCHPCVTVCILARKYIVLKCLGLQNFPLTRCFSFSPPSAHVQSSTESLSLLFFNRMFHLSYSQLLFYIFITDALKMNSMSPFKTMKPTVSGFNIFNSSS